MKFRRATVDDATEIVSFWRQSGASMLPTDTVESVAVALRNPTAALVLATNESGIVGTLLGTFDGWRAHLYRLVVHPDQRRQGIGRRLVREMEHLFAGWGARWVIALVEADRPRAMEFWTAVGYPRDDHDLVYVGDLKGSVDRRNSN